jgi:hypothetical protein
VVFPQRSSGGGIQRLCGPEGESRTEAVRQEAIASFTVNDLNEGTAVAMRSKRLANLVPALVARMHVFLADL